MNIQKFTQKSVEAIQKAQSIAIENHNSQIEQEHLLLALLEQDNSLIKELLKKIGTYAREDLEKMLDIKVNLKLWVKVKEDWLNNDQFVKKFKLQ